MIFKGLRILDKLFHWYITRHPVDTHHEPKLSGRDYLGKEVCFYVVRGRIKKGTDLFGQYKRRTSAIKSMEYIEREEMLRVYTQNSVYDCLLSDCRRERQEPFEVLPTPVQEVAEAKLHPLIPGPSETDTILLVFDESDNDFNFVDAAFNRGGNTSRLAACSNIGSYSDSFLITEDFDGPMNIDIRYFPAASREGKYIEFYSFDTDGLSAYLYNVGETKLSFLTFEGIIDLLPGERKLVSPENIAPDSKERLIADREEARAKLGRFFSKKESNGV